jgi:5'-nucleotidase
MKILLTNDDGIDADGLALLLDFFKTVGDVTVVAPLVQQSGKSLRQCLTNGVF